MTHFELVGISGLILVLILFVLLVLGMHRKTLFLILVNGLVAMLIYYVLLLTGNISTSRFHSVMVGVFGIFYLMSLPFI